MSCQLLSCPVPLSLHVLHSRRSTIPALQHSVQHPAPSTWDSFQLIFLIADVRHTILGTNFFRHFNLSVDMTWGHLIDSLTQIQINGTLTEGIFPQSLSVPPIC